MHVKIILKNGTSHLFYVSEILFQTVGSPAGRRKLSSSSKNNKFLEKENTYVAAALMGLFLKTFKFMTHTLFLNEKLALKTPFAAVRDLCIHQFEKREMPIKEELVKKNC